MNHKSSQDLVLINLTNSARVMQGCTYSVVIEIKCACMVGGGDRLIRKMLTSKIKFNFKKKFFKKEENCHAVLTISFYFVNFTSFLMLLENGSNYIIIEVFICKFKNKLGGMPVDFRQSFVWLPFILIRVL